MTIHQDRRTLDTFESVRTMEGEGFAVTRPFPTARLDHFGPFLLLDEMGPSDNAPGQAKGAPDHPHRGFETVTYVLDGEIEHKDSQGNRGVIRPGDVQWMTAGSGIVHSEMPTDLIMNAGGRVHGFQLWVNLPAKAKMHRPRYQGLLSSEMPVVELAGGQAVVIAGHTLGVDGAADTFLEITYLHVKVNPQERMTLEIEPSHIAFVYPFQGSGWAGYGRAPVQHGTLAMFDTGGGKITLEAGSSGLEALVGMAEPLNEPLARYGPFVMNTRAEILQAFEDYQAGRLGQIEAEIA